MNEGNPDLCKQKENKVVLPTTANVEFRPEALNETKGEASILLNTIINI